MKKCSYCGKEYPADATVCVIDTEPLIDPNAPKEMPGVPAVQIEEKQAAKPKPEAPYLPWPDYQWRAKDAWKCVGMLFCFSFVLFAINHLQYLTFPNFYRSPVGLVCRHILYYAVTMTTACYFARTETLADVGKAFGLDRKPTNLVWFGLTMALILRFVSHFMHLHWGSGVYNYDLIGFRNTIGPEKWLFQFSPLVLAPIFEECVNRGFLYKAFRASYSLPICMLLMVAWTCNTHWSYYRESWIAAIYLSAWTILQCYLREKSRSLWDCILCHCVSNAVILFYSASG